MPSRRCFLAQSGGGKVANWPEFRGLGDSLSGYCESTAQLGSGKESRVEGGDAGYGQSSPVVWDDRVFLTSIDGAEKETLYVFCLDLKSGSELWRRQFAATQPVKNDDMTSKGAPTPCVDRDRLYVFFESGDLLALDHDGRQLWSRKLTEEYGPFQGNHGVGSSPRLTSDGVAILVAQGGPSYLLLADKASGKTLWRTERETKTAWTTPCIVRHGGKEQIVVSVNGRIESYAADDGRSLWLVDGIRGNLFSSATIAGDLLVAGSAKRETSLRFNFPPKEGGRPVSHGRPRTPHRTLVLL